MNRHQSLRERHTFIEDALVSATDQCILWPFGKSEGYGEITIDYTKHRVHRLVCQRAHGLAPYPGMDAAHSCNVPACINPRHLSWKDRKGNMADQLVHGTRAKGERHGAAKLTQQQVDEIRQQWATGEWTQRALADEFGVSRSMVQNIIHGRKWV